MRERHGLCEGCGWSRAGQPGVGRAQGGHRTGRWQGVLLGSARLREGAPCSVPLTQPMCLECARAVPLCARCAICWFVRMLLLHSFPFLSALLVPCWCGGVGASAHSVACWVRCQGHGAERSSRWEWPARPIAGMCCIGASAPGKRSWCALTSGRSLVGQGAHHLCNHGTCARGQVVCTCGAQLVS